jgi:hypothetical protein
MDKDYLTLKHAPIGPNEEDYDVLFDSVLVGRIVLSPAAPKDRQMWSLDHRDRSPTRGCEPTREAVMAVAPPLRTGRCPIPATNRETLARLLPQTAKPKSLRRNTPEAGVR